MGINSQIIYKFSLTLQAPNPIKWSNTLKKSVGYQLTNCLGVFGHFVELAPKGLNKSKITKFDEALNSGKVYKESGPFSSFSIVNLIQVTLHKNYTKNFPLTISSVNKTISAVNCGSGHIYGRNP